MGAVDASARAGTRPRKYGDPSGPTAISDTRAGSLADARSPGDRAIGSHTKVTRVFPFSPRDVPIQVRTTLARLGRLTAEARAASTGLGTAGFGGASARAVCSAFSAQYPFRARTCSPWRLTRTLISWNLPSDGASVEL